jgi:alkylation response protein AidB-like acyl-CoA dehydrogenase
MSAVLSAAPGPPRRRIFDAEHELFRSVVRTFIEREVVPFHAEWEAAKCVPRALWQAAGSAGLLCPSTPERYGGAGGDFRFGAIVTEELSRAGASGPCFPLHSEIVAPYLLKYGTEEQRLRWLPAMVAGTCIGAIAMTEPGTGSDLGNIATRAERRGDGWAVTGSKTFITNGQLADLVIVAAKTDARAGAKGVSLFLVAADAPGFARGRNLDKLGLHAQDTSELFFDAAPAEMLGPEGAGFGLMMNELPQERLIVAIGSAAGAEAALEWTIAYCAQRHAFGKPILDFQNTRFVLADVATETAVGRSFVDDCIERHVDGRLGIEQAVMAKLWLSEMQFRITDACLQLFGGYGYMEEYPIARMWASARVHRIYAGTNEIMREMIGRHIRARADALG